MKFRSSRALIAAAAMAVAALALTACTTGNSGADSTSAQQVKSFALIGGVRDSPFYSAIDCGAKTEAGKLKVQYTYSAPETFSPASQQPILSSVVAKSPNAIAIAPTDSTAMFQPIHQAKAAGITMMTVDTALNDTSDLSAQITSDNIAGGALGADEMAKLIGESGKVVAVSEPPGSSTDDLRVKGFVDRIKAKYPKIQLLTTQFADHSAQATASQVASVIAANPDLKGVFAVDNFTGDGAPIGVANANAQNTVKIIAFDAQPSQVQALKAGQIAGIVSQNPYQMGVDSVQQAVQLGQGKTVAKKTITPLKFITKDNVGDPSSQPFIYKSC